MRTDCVLPYLGLTLLFSSLASAQIPACGEKVLPLSVKTSAGAPVQGLAPSDFEATLDGKPLQILSAAPDLRPHRLVILLDSSSSMSHDEFTARWDFALTLARHIAGAGGPQNRIALLLFAEDVIEVDDFSKGNAAILGRLREIDVKSAFVREKARGKTALYDAMANALKLLDHPTSADALYIITDGGENSSHLRSKALEKLFDVSPVRLFASLLIEPQSREEAPPSATIELADLARNTGGAVLAWETVSRTAHIWSLYHADLHATTDEQLRWFYHGMFQNDLITLRLSADINKRRRLELALSPSNRKKWKDAEVLYPSRIEPCAATAVAGDAQP